MEVPAVNHSYTHPQPWAGQSPRTPTIPPPSCPFPSYHYPNLNPDQQSVTPMTQTTGTAAGHRPQSLQSYQGVFKPVPEITNKTNQGMPQRSYSLPTSPVSNSKTESRYGLDPQLLPSVVQVIKEDRIQWEGKVFVSECKSSVPLLPGQSSTGNSEMEQERFRADLSRCVDMQMAFKVQLRVFVSKDIDAFSPDWMMTPLSLCLPFAPRQSVSADNANMPSLGEAVRCTVSSLDPGGLYLIYCPLALLLWVGSCVPPHTLLQLFNTNSFSNLTSGEIKLPVLENSLSISTRALICSLQSSAAVTLQLKLVREGDSCEESLQLLLVEDKSPNGGASYADFLFHLHVNALRLVV
ncbi:uncharacterized protein [Sinocyclocheilus grahami]|uniref:uncharacterized protein n=1 Tax=Sinocyclocheilus grahami TaxID=75366 RepID=UPI0007ACC8EF|nr:PREDICTED: uncharacterized protein LOC107597325 [Sinocyclocheilus grahami]